MMWNFASSTFANIRVKKNSTEPNRTCSECSDDEVCSNVSRDEALECPICWESFNIVENVPYVLWCGHTLCKNCILGLEGAVLKFSTQQIKVPFFISCPWCHLLSFRLFYKGNLRFPRKNFFLHWMVESLNGNRVKFVSSSGVGQPRSPKTNFLLGNQASNCNLRRISPSHCSGLWRRNSEDGGTGSDGERTQFSLHKSLDFFIHFTSKFPLVIIFLLIAFFAVPGSAIILALYLLVTIVFAIPSFMVLYFAYPMLERLIKEITS
ncbi:RING finger protein [Quillaja saponaria]|uniref:RING finger protein n=1 Tax=Quillaja saponaria TaxID=32244 RepID=A0AAD7L938_QUISA|nr:RING finger protein [Quillaja saponaria]